MIDRGIESDKRGTVAKLNRHPFVLAVLQSIGIFGLSCLQLLERKIHLAARTGKLQEGVVALLDDFGSQRQQGEVGAL